MKKLLLSILVVATVLATGLLQGCYKDKGNYTYNEPETPVLVDFDTLYDVLVGDSLIIEPEISMKAEAELELAWRITVISGTGPANRDIVDTGSSFRVMFGLAPGVYTGRLTIHNKTNDMKYFHYFKVRSTTEFDKGTVILTSENGASQISFLRPDGTLQSRLFQAINPEVKVPEQPFQLLAAPVWAQPNTVDTYWVFGKGGANTGIQIDANTFTFKKTLADNFFDKPDVVAPARLYTAHTGVLVGMINGRMYNGSTNTWNLAPVYGMFSSSAVGEYDLAPQYAYVLNDNAHMPGNPLVAYDKTRKGFVWFAQSGEAPGYMGINYGVTGGAFDPLNVGLELIHLQQISIRSGICFAFAKDANGDIWELKFNAKLGLTEPVKVIEAIHKRKFIQPALITAATTWQSTDDEIMFLASGDKIYRYNPISQEIIPLQTNFSGKEVTILNMLDNGNTLIAGTEGTVYYLDVSTGKLGNTIKTIEHLPGKPIGLVVRK